MNHVVPAPRPLRGRNIANVLCHGNGNCYRSMTEETEPWVQTEVLED